MKNTTTLGFIIAIALLLPSLAITKHYAYDIPKDKKAGVATETWKRIQFENCIGNAETTYSENWDLGCKDLGKQNDCSLPRYRANPLDDDMASAKTLCAKLYQ